MRGLAALLSALALLLLALSLPIGIMPPIGGLLAPSGFFSSALSAEYPSVMVVEAEELSSPVAVLRDRYGVPHIFAERYLDACFALGYLHARDRLWQIDVQRRLASGRLSEVFGNRTLEQDIFMRTIGLNRAAARTLEAYNKSEEFYRALEAYAAGVNKYIREAGAALPLEFKLLNYKPEPYTVYDAVLWNKMMAWSLSGSFHDILAKILWDKLGEDAEELFPMYRPFDIPVVPSQRGATLKLEPPAVNATFTVGEYLKLSKLASIPWMRALGSNNWAVDGVKSATGKPMLASDPHLQLTLPPLWYEVHIATPELEVYGVTFPGAPFVVIGFNRHIAWGLTNVGGDVVDLYVEKFSRENPELYLYKGEWLQVKRVEEVIKVRGGEPYKLVVKETIHGPLVTHRGHRAAMKWTGSEPTFELKALYLINKAKSYREFINALKYFHCPPQNFAYADVDGNIAMWVVGKFPIRAKGLGLFPADGSSGEYEWTGYIPLEELPHVVNPPQHYVASANQRSAGDEYPYYIGRVFAPTYRARRINQLLSEADEVTLEDMARFQNDVYDLAASRFIPYLLAAYEEAEPESELVAQALSYLRRWDYRMTVDSVAATIWYEWIREYERETWGDEWRKLGLEGLMYPPIEVLENYTITGYQKWFDNVFTSEVEDRDQVIRASFRKAVGKLSRKLGSDLGKWTWGSYHMLELKALSYPLTPLDGSMYTLSVAAGTRVKHGPSWRMLVDLSDLENSMGVYPGGQIASAMSKHYTDLLELWLKHEYHKILLPRAPEDIPSELVESRVEFRPKGG